jgi:2',3'-cyclic-nucleotide 2'-phosphodiesterase (5'-nucleotidase family)
MLYELQPFQNELVTVEVTGAQLRAALENAIGDEGRHAHVSGMEVTYDPAAEPARGCAPSASPTAAPSATTT